MIEVLTRDDIELIAQRVAEIVLERMPTENRPAADDRRYWNESEVARQLGISKWMLKKARDEGHIEAHTNRRPILYSAEQIEAVEEWLARRASDC